MERGEKLPINLNSFQLQLLVAEQVKEQEMVQELGFQKIFQCQVLSKYQWQYQHYYNLMPIERSSEKKRKRKKEKEKKKKKKRKKERKEKKSRKPTKNIASIEFPAFMYCAIWFLVASRVVVRFFSFSVSDGCECETLMRAFWRFDSNVCCKLWIFLWFTFF